MTFDRIDQEQFYRRVTEELFEKFTPLPSGVGDATSGQTLITNEITSAVPTVVVVASDASSWIIEAAQEAIFAGRAGWYICDGVDDHEEIQAAIDSLTAAIGGRVLLSAGEFHPDWDLIDVPGRVILQGMGRGSTVIDMNDTNPTTGTGPAIDIPSGGQPWAAVRDLSIWLPSNGLSSQIGIRTGKANTLIDNVDIEAGEGIGLDINADQCVVRGCYFDDNVTHIDDGGSYTTITGCVFIDGDIGINVTQNFTNISDCVFITDYITPRGDIYLNIVESVAITNCDFLGNAYGIESNGATECTITGNKFDCGESAIYGNTLGNSTITGNKFRGASNGIELTSSATNCVISANSFQSMEIAVLITGGAGTIIQGNSIHFPDNHSISLTDSSECVIADNLIVDFNTTTNTYDAIILAGNSDRNHIHGNKIGAPFSNQLRYGINISASTCDNNRIGDNDYGIVADYGTFPLNDAGTNTRYPSAKEVAMSISGAAGVGSGAARYPIAEDAIYIDAHATAGTAPSGGAQVFDINKNGTTVYGTATNPQIADGANVGSKAPGDQTLFAEDDYITLDVDTDNGAEDVTVVVRLLVA